MKMLKSKLLDLKEKEQKEKIEDLKEFKWILLGAVRYVLMFFVLIPW